MLKGVLPVPPTKIFPTQIIGKLNLFSLITSDFKVLNKIVIKEKGSNIRDIKFILSQNFGLFNII